MLRPILQHIEQRGSSLTGRLQLVRVVPIQEDAPLPVQGAIHRARHANGESLHPARKRTRIAGLDDQVQMVRLKREMATRKAGFCPPASASRSARNTSLSPRKLGNPALALIVTCTG
jgi:hypothetical protein